MPSAVWDEENVFPQTTGQPRIPPLSSLSLDVWGSKGPLDSAPSGSGEGEKRYQSWRLQRGDVPALPPREAAAMHGKRPGLHPPDGRSNYRFPPGPGTGSGLLSFPKRLPLPGYPLPEVALDDAKVSRNGNSGRNKSAA